MRKTYTTRSSEIQKVLFPETHTTPEKTTEPTTPKRKLDFNLTTTTTTKQTLSTKQLKSDQLSDVKGTKLVSEDMFINGKYKHSIEIYRQKLDNAKPALPLTEKVNIIRKKLLHYQDHVFNATIFIPQNLKPPYPTLIYVPGTGFVANPNQFSEMVDSLTAKHGLCQVVFIEEKVAPENKYPSALNELIAFLKYIFDPKTNDLNIDSNRIAAAGYCSGANLLLLALLALKKENKREYPIQHLFLLSPFVDLSRSLTQTDAYKTCKQNEDQDTVVSEPYVEWLVNQYIPDDINQLEPMYRSHALKHPSLSPYYADYAELALLPNITLFYGKKDRFYSDSVAFSQKLAEAHRLLTNPPTLDVYVTDDTHGFAWNNRAVLETTAKMIKHTFSKSITPLRALLSAAQLTRIHPSPQSKRNQNESVGYTEILKTALYDSEFGWEQQILTNASKLRPVVISQLLNSNEATFIENRLVEILKPYMNPNQSLNSYIDTCESQSKTLTQNTELKYRVIVASSLLKKYHEKTQKPNTINNKNIFWSDNDDPTGSPTEDNEQLSITIKK